MLNAKPILLSVLLTPLSGCVATPVTTDPPATTNGKFSPIVEVTPIVTDGCGNILPPNQWAVIQSTLRGHTRVNTNGEKTMPMMPGASTTATVEHLMTGVGLTADFTLQYGLPTFNLDLPCRSARPM